MDELPHIFSGMSWGRHMQHCCRGAQTAYRVHTLMHPMGTCLPKTLIGVCETVPLDLNCICCDLSGMICCLILLKLVAGTIGMSRKTAAAHT